MGHIKCANSVNREIGQLSPGAFSARRTLIVASKELKTGHATDGRRFATELEHCNVGAVRDVAG